MMELMQKSTKDDGATGVDDLERWPSDSDAVGFLSAITSADSVDELKKVSLIFESIQIFSISLFVAPILVTAALE